MARWAALTCAAAFGPFTAGVMTGQVVVLAFASIILMTGWPLIITARPTPLPTLGLWTGICAVMPPLPHLGFRLHWSPSV